MRIGGVVLCGGRSSRMGKPKAWLPFGNETMLQRVVRVVGEVTQSVVVVAAPGQELPELPASVRIARDEIEGQGPLGGVAAGLTSLEGTVDAVYLSSCDVPFLKPAFVRRVIDLLGDASIAVPQVGEYFHPLAAVYHISVLPHVRTLLAEGRLRPAFLFDLVPTRIISERELLDVDSEFRSLRNLNTLIEYEAALQELDSPSS